MELTQKLNRDRRGILVFAGRIARELLDRGYIILDIMANKANPQHTVFVFKQEGNILNDISILKGMENLNINTSH